MIRCNKNSSGSYNTNNRKSNINRIKNELKYKKDERKEKNSLFIHTIVLLHGVCTRGTYQDLHIDVLNFEI